MAVGRGARAPRSAPTLQISRLDASQQRATHGGSVWVGGSVSWRAVVSSAGRVRGVCGGVSASWPSVQNLAKNLNSNGQKVTAFARAHAGGRCGVARCVWMRDGGGDVHAGRRRACGRREGGAVWRPAPVCVGAGARGRCVRRRGAAGGVGPMGRRVRAERVRRRGSEVSARAPTAPVGGEGARRRRARAAAICLFGV